jgi:hypothetical protein
MALYIHAHQGIGANCGLPRLMLTSSAVHMGYSDEFSTRGWRWPPVEELRMIIVEPCHRSRPFQSVKTHARLKHDYATWHPDHVDKTLSTSSYKLPYMGNNKTGKSASSKFDSAKIIEEAISKSYEHVAQVARNGNHVVVFDMGYQVGFDEVAKRRVSVVTVVLKRSGEVITAHPGTPWSRDQNEA